MTKHHDVKFPRRDQITHATQAHAAQSHVAAVAVEEKPMAGRKWHVAEAPTWRQSGSTWGWTFPLLLSAAVVLSTAAVFLSIHPSAQNVSPDELSARMTWAVAAMLYLVFFVFSAVACVTLMFRCGRDRHAMLGLVATTAIGVWAIAISLASNASYLGPAQMGKYLEATAFALHGVRFAASIFDGCAVWAFALVIATSCVILLNDIHSGEEKAAERLSRQLRGSKILMYVAAALLVTGVAEVSALHKWPAYRYKPTTAAVAAAAAAKQPAPHDESKDIEQMATAISSIVGTVFSMVLAAAYLPLAILLRQRAYRILPYERAESWLAVHGFALQPTQQLAKIALILSPLIAGGPVSSLISILRSY